MDMYRKREMRVEMEKDDSPKSFQSVGINWENDNMEYYIKINGQDYLLPSDVIAYDKKIIMKYVVQDNERYYLNLEAIKNSGEVEDMEELYNSIHSSVGTNAFNMSAVGMYSRVDKQFDPLVDYMNIDVRLKDRKKIIDNTLDNYKKCDIMIESIYELLMLNKLMIENDEFVNNKVR